MERGSTWAFDIFVPVLEPTDEVSLRPGPTCDSAAERPVCREILGRGSAETPLLG